MNCENYLCVYEEGGKCRLENIALDIVGKCTACVYPSFEKNVLKEAKAETLENMK